MSKEVPNVIEALDNLNLRRPAGVECLGSWSFTMVRGPSQLPGNGEGAYSVVLEASILEHQEKYAVFPSERQ